MTARYFKVPLSLTATAWVPVVAPIDCDHFWIRAQDGQSVILESMTDRETGDEGFDDILPGGALQYLPLPCGSRRFPEGTVITYLRAQSNNCVAVATFIL